MIHGNPVRSSSSIRHSPNLPRNQQRSLPGLTLVFWGPCVLCCSLKGIQVETTVRLETNKGIIIKLVRSMCCFKPIYSQFPWVRQTSGVLAHKLICLFKNITMTLYVQQYKNIIYVATIGSDLGLSYYCTCRSPE